ncbi:MAG: hypothetical protein EPN20_12925 [Magnetospirillum sp.]|nr:MAG: hypothetical protein EPN20_12925 [Magnetospirillum sp.]
MRPVGGYHRRGRRHPLPDADRRRHRRRQAARPARNHPARPIAQGALTALATTLKVAGEATMPVIATAAQQIAAGAGQIDLTKYVPMDIYLALANQAAQTGEAEVTRTVDDAVTAGKIAPPMKAHWLAVASQNLAGFKELVAKMPVLVAPAGQQRQVPGVPLATADQLNADELAVAAQLGQTAEQYRKTKEGK